MPWSKLRPRSLGTFPVRAVSDNTIVVEYHHGRQHVSFYRVVKVSGQPSELPRVPSLSSPSFGDNDRIFDFRTPLHWTSYRVQWGDGRPSSWVPLSRDLPYSAVFAYHDRSGVRFPTSQLRESHRLAVNHRCVRKIGQPSPYFRAWGDNTTVLATSVALATTASTLLGRTMWPYCTLGGHWQTQMPGFPCC